MAKTSKKSFFDEKHLTKGELRKLNALRKSLGNDIADKAFAEWFAQSGAGSNTSEDKNADVVVEALQPLFKDKELRIPRGGFLVTRWRDKLVVKPASPRE